jgi:hypothetical protein
MLRIVHPAPVGQGTATPKRRGVLSPCLTLTAEETRHFRASLKNMARAFGTWACLAEVIGVPVACLKTAISKGRRPSGILVIRTAQAAGMSVEAIIGGKLSAAGRCSSCGSRVGDRADRRAAS